MNTKVSREIKFRALTKDLEGNQYMSFSDRYEDDEIPTSEHTLMSYFFRNLSTDAVLMQWTGLKDKNGKEIYEGDVIVIDGNKKTLVSWSEKFASFCVKNDTWMFQHWFGEAVNPIECEIVGNIYEHPNLL